MPRMARIVVPGIAHHLTQRGNRRQLVFFQDNHRQRYLQLLLEYSIYHGLLILAYCLMTNHVHLIAIPVSAASLASVMKPLNQRYTQFINQMVLGISGRRWQGRFFSCPLDEPHLRAAIRYAGRNPVRVRMVAKAEHYPWSSAAAHCGLRADPFPVALPEVRPAETADWSAWLAERDNEKTLVTLRLHTRTGRPAGAEQFVSDLESRLGWRLQAQPVGRPARYRSQTSELPNRATSPVLRFTKSHFQGSSWDWFVAGVLSVLASNT
jgi:putative transposase